MDRSVNPTDVGENEAPQKPVRVQTDTRILALMVGSFIETFTIGVGLWWIMSGGEELSLKTRVAIVTVFTLVISVCVIVVAMKSGGKNSTDLHD